MAKVKLTDESKSAKKMRPAITPEARENQMISLAMDLAEQQLRDGTASSQLITEFVKRGSEKTRLENAKLKEENELLRAKTESLQSQKRVEELYMQALDAIRGYAGYDNKDE